MPLIDVLAREIADRFEPIADDAPILPGALIPFARLQAAAAAGQALPRPLGVAVEPSTTAAQLAPLLRHLDLVAVGFPKFRDGRGFTLARTLRERFGFAGEIRATGHVLPDQLLALRQCGVSTIATPAQHPRAQFVALLASSPAEAPRQLLNRALHRARG